MMIGLEYICEVFGCSLSDVARELGVTPQTVHDWVKIIEDKEGKKPKRKIPKKRLEQLSEMFNLDESFFQKELNEIEKIDVQIAHIEKLSKESLEVIYEKDEEGNVCSYTYDPYYDTRRFLYELRDKKVFMQEIWDLIMDETFDEDHYLDNRKQLNYKIFEDIVTVLKSNDHKKIETLRTVAYLLSGKWGKYPHPFYKANDGDKIFDEIYDLLKKHEIID